MQSQYLATKNAVDFAELQVLVTVDVKHGCSTLTARTNA